MEARSFFSFTKEVSCPRAPRDDAVRDSFPSRKLSEERLRRKLCFRKELRPIRLSKLSLSTALSRQRTRDPTTNFRRSLFITHHQKDSHISPGSSPTLADGVFQKKNSCVELPPTPAVLPVESPPRASNTEFELRDDRNCIEHSIFTEVLDQRCSNPLRSSRVGRRREGKLQPYF